MRAKNPLSRLLATFCAVTFTGSNLEAESVVTFNELNYNPAEGSDGEWIELHSQMVIDTDLSGWTLDEGVNYVFPAGTILPGGGYLLIARNPGSLSVPNGVTVLGPYEGSLSNGGEEVTLVSLSGRLMDEVDYEDSDEWPVAADGSGVTLAKRLPELSSTRSVNWTSSAEIGGTPGASNFIGTGSIEPTLVLNEVSGAEDLSVFVEIRNASSGTINTSGYVLGIDGDNPVEISLPAMNLDGGSLLVLNEESLEQRPEAGARLFLRTPGGAGVADAQVVSNRLQGSSPDFPGQWIFPSTPTPNEVNVFDLESNVVINEIFYNGPLLPGTAAIPPTFERVELIPSNATWRYNESGEDLGTSWAQTAHPVGGNWESGPATIGFDTGSPFPIATAVDAPSSNDPYVLTYYFESDFTLDAQQAANLTTLELEHLIDDGAVFYLNGVEIERVRMGDGVITASSVAAQSVNVATTGTVAVDIPAGLAVAGTNRLSAEVHQNSNRSGDVVFGLSVDAIEMTDEGTPGEPRAESRQQWLELHNRGVLDVDLSGWEFGEGIGYAFESGTILAAGDYLVIARDPSEVQADHPGISFLGPFSGSLSGGGETLILLDAVGNPADMVRYDDGGRWPTAPDGGGSSLELRDPDADNALPSAWAASEELARTVWRTYSYRGIAEPSPVGPDSQWEDFVIGLLEEGEVLLDDISVIEDPDGSAIQVITDGTFERGNFDSWRARGNHRRVSIVPDPDGGGNVLRLLATGSTEHMHNSLETTLADERTIENGREYEISYRARFLSGNNLLNTRLYFNRLPRTIELERPTVYGTPGVANSTSVNNSGPTGDELTHSPPVPNAGQSTTISASFTDPDGMGNVTLHYSVESGPFQQVSMTPDSAGAGFTGTVPGQSAGDTVQFYLEATDTLGAVSLLPAAGPDSAALFEVQDGRSVSTGIHNIRLLMTPDNVELMFTPINLMSNDRIPCAVIYNEEEIYYDAGVRIKGSQRGRPRANRVGFNIAFPRDNLFRDFHRTVAIDRSEGDNVGQRELLFDVTANSSGGVPGEFNDLCYVISPDPRHTSAAILQMARFGSAFLDSQFEDGGDGTVFEYELIYFPTMADDDGFKFPNPDSIRNTDITSLGPDPESYRYNFQVKNNQEFDDLSGSIRLGSLFDLGAEAFDAEVENVLDIEQWLRSLAYNCASGAGDSFFTNSRHNGQFYQRPDGKILFFPHDMDRGFSATRGIFANSELQQITANPSRQRIYLGHLHDICTTVFNQSYMQRVTDNFEELTPGAPSFTDDLEFINARSNFILSQIDSSVSPIDFAITTNGGFDFTSDTSPVTLAGNGWVNVRDIRLAGSPTALPVVWTDEQSWQVTVPLVQGANNLVLDAFDFSGALIGSDSINVTSSSVTNLPSRESLVVSEINYNPNGADLTEFIELLNVSSTDTLDLTGLSFTEGIVFSFPSGASLRPGERVLVVRDLVGFQAVFGSDLPVAGVYEGALSNSGETIALTLANGDLIQSFTYDVNDPWPSIADGDGFSLVLLNPSSAPDHGDPLNWRAGTNPNGSPSVSDVIDLATWKNGFGNPANDADPDGDGWTVIEEFFFGGSPTTRDNLAPQITFDFATGQVSASVTRRANAEGGAPRLFRSTDLVDWQLVPGLELQATERLPDSSQLIDRLVFSGLINNGVTGETGERAEFFRFEFRN